jgi:hypothetical protein
MKRTPIKRVSDKRKAELAEYRKLRKQFLADHPIDQIWLVENGWTEIGNALFQKGNQIRNAGLLVVQFNAPRADQIHHRNKRRGPMLNATQFWLALGRANHERVENSKTWARLNGYLLAF